MEGPPGLRYTIAPIAFTTFIGLIVASIFTWNMKNYKEIVFGIIVVIFFFIGWVLAGWIHDRAYSYNYNVIESTVKSSFPAQVSASDGTVVMSLHIHDDKGQDISKEIRGLTIPEWHMLGMGVRKYNGYSWRILQEIFGEARGATIYSIITNILKDERVRILVKDGTGLKPSEGRGRSFFEHLEKEQYEILGMLDAVSPSPIT